MAGRAAAGSERDVANGRDRTDRQKMPKLPRLERNGAKRSRDNGKIIYVCVCVQRTEKSLKFYILPVDAKILDENFLFFSKVRQSV